MICLDRIHFIDTSIGGLNMDEATFLGVTEALQVHARPGQIAFMFYELLTASDYSDEEILEVATALENIVN